MLDGNVFDRHFGMLEERFNKRWSPEAIAEWLRFLQEQGVTNEQFVSISRILFRSNREFFPTPQEFIDLLRAESPPPYQLPAHYPKAYGDMSPAEQQQHREAIAAARQKLVIPAGSSSGMTAIGRLIQVLEPVPELTAEEKYLQDLAQFESYQRTYEAYRSSEQYREIAMRALGQIEALCRTAEPAIVQRCNEFLDAVEGETDAA